MPPIHLLYALKQHGGYFIMITDKLSFCVTLKEQNGTVTIFAEPSVGKAGNVLSLPQINCLLKLHQQLAC